MSGIRAKVLWWAVQRRISIDQPFIIAITGSIAKTSTKTAIGAVLRRAYPRQVRVGYGNLNSFLGVPLAVLGLEADFYKQKIGLLGWIWLLMVTVWRGLFSTLPNYIVLEYGADKPGDIGALAAMIKIDAAAITIVSPAHLEFYDSVEAIAREKAKILSAIKKGGWALVNKADPYLKVYEPFKIELITVETKTIDIAINYARAVGQKMKIDNRLIDEAITTLPRPEGRLQLRDLGRLHLLDDSYNANPLSMTAALEWLSKMPSPRVAVLGDMLELGPDAPKYHQEIGQKAHAAADKVIGVGELAANYQPDLMFKNSTTALASVLSEAALGGSMLIKGSHGIHMEKIVQAINQQFSKR